MANIASKIKIKTALPAKTRKPPMMFNYLSSTSFFRPCPCHFYEVSPDQDIELKHQHMLRFDPLFKPFLGSAKLSMNCFFVPYRTINRSWDDYITDTLHAWSDGSSPSIVTTDRYIEMGVIQDMFLDMNLFDLVEPVVHSTGAHESVIDFALEPSHPSYDNANEGYVFTSDGLHFMKILESLGYRVSFSVSDRTVKRSIQPLLSLVRVFADWYYPGSYSNLVEFQYVLSFLDSNIPSKMNLTVGSSIYTGLTSQELLYQMLHLCSRATYDLDYYTSAFDNPSGPNQSLFSTFDITDPNLLKTATNSFDNNVINSYNATGNPFSVPVYRGAVASGGTFKISDQGLSILHSLTLYLRRHQLAGSRNVDRFLSRFGFTNTPEKFDRSILVGQKSISIPVGDVMSHSDTTGASLGEYSGQAASNSTFDFDFQNQSVDYGMLITIYNVVPQASYCQGERREVMNIAKLDHWTPEFDGRSVHAIAKSQLLVSKNPFNSMGVINNDPYGYSPTYSWQKCGFDVVTGLFNNRSLYKESAGGSVTYGQYNNYSSWFLQRMLPETVNASNIIHASSALISTDRGQYNRVFYDTDLQAMDNMYIIVRTIQQNNDHMLGVFDDYMLEHDDNGQDISIRNQGVTLS